MSVKTRGIFRSWEKKPRDEIHQVLLAEFLIVKVPVNNQESRVLMGEFRPGPSKCKFYLILWLQSTFLPSPSSFFTNYNLKLLFCTFLNIKNVSHERSFWGNFLRLSILVFFIDCFCLHNKLYIDCYIFWF